jgi:pyrroline-5-carboxylate reductase
MATALARGWIQAGLTNSSRGLAADPSPEARAAFTRETGLRATPANREVIDAADVLVLAVKPQDMQALLGEIRQAITTQHLLISIAAGFTFDQLCESLGPNCRLARVIPNTPCLIGACAAGYALGSTATVEDAALVDRLLNAVGRAFRLPENQLDAVTGLSASGPAFVYVMIEALSDGGVRVGLSRNVALALAAQTVFGAAKMVLESGTHPGILKDMVASPGGTTIAGLHALERGGLRAALIDAVEAATQRSAELARG